MAQTIVIKINIENAAFEEGGTNEVARILRNLADRYEGTGLLFQQKLRDVNGNTVGSAMLEVSRS